MPAYNTLRSILRRYWAWKQRDLYFRLSR